MNPYVGLIFDLLILAALGATIFHALRLSKQFTKMQADRKAFEQLIAAMNVASSRAEAAIKAFKDTALDSGDKLQEKINTARGLTDELEIMIQAGDSLADRLGAAAEKGRKGALPEPNAPTARAAEPRSRAEKELLEALKSRQQP